jgi:hypothetical protein
MSKKQQIEEANEIAVNRIVNSDPVIIDVRPAIEVVPGMTERTILHSGPPITWDRMCPPQKGGVIGAMLFEGLANSVEEAEKIAAEGEITLDPCHHHQTVGSMTGVTSANMWVHVVKNRDYGNTGFCAIYEGRGKTTAFGCHDTGTVKRLQWMDEVLGPTLQAALRKSDGIDLKGIIARALSMGDECHNRNTASTLLFTYSMVPLLIEAGIDDETIVEATRFITEPHYNYFLTLSMPASKASLDAAHGIENSTIVTAMARNGTDFGIRVSGLGNRWFIAPAPEIKGLYFPGFKAEDANPDMGDSAITETAGLGGFAIAASPAIIGLVGGTIQEAINYTREMSEITATRNTNFQIPYLNFQGTPTGIDIRKVVETGIHPVIDTGISHKKANVGHIGAGITRAPLECFNEALKSFLQ